MGFKKEKKKLVRCLLSGDIRHEVRGNIEIKNLLATGQCTSGDLAKVINRAKGTEYHRSPHHFDATIDVHVIRTTQSELNWYIKWYFIEPNSVFISVHH